MEESTEVVRQPQQVQSENERKNGAQASKEPETTQHQGDSPYARKQGKPAAGWHRENTEKRDGRPEALRNFAPGTEIFSKVEQEDRTKEEDSAQTKVQGPRRLEPKVHPPCAERLQSRAIHPGVDLPRRSATGGPVG